MIKLLVLDLDGTLLNSEKEIDERDKEAVKRVMEKGIKVTIFTGRSRHSARKYVKELGIGVPVVFQNGALIVDFGSGEVLRKIELDGEIARRVVKRARKYDVFYIVYTDFSTIKDMMVDRPYKGGYDYYMKQNSWRIYFVRDVFDHIGKSVAEIALIGEDGKIKEIVKDLESASVIKSTEVGDESFWEVFGPGCSKAEALKFLMDHFKVRPEEVMFIGDGYNDIEIMDIVGFPVAMGNAPDEVKKHAKYVTLDNDSAGVARAIEDLILKDGK